MRRYTVMGFGMMESVMFDLYTRLGFGAMVCVYSSLRASPSSHALFQNARLDLTSLIPE
jgi:hypothetical protein